MRARAGWRVLLLSLGVVLVSGCSDSNMDDLREYVEEVKARQGGRIEPLPEIKTFTSFEYKADDQRAPFKPWASTVEAQAESASQVRPDTDRQPEPLERYELESLQMVGTISRDGNRFAVVSAPDGVVYRVQEGSYLGQNNGRITRIREDQIKLVEIVPDGLGGWQKQQTSLALPE